MPYLRRALQGRRRHPVPTVHYPSGRPEAARAVLRSRCLRRARQIDSGDLPVTRCWWPGEDPLYIAYHDKEWGMPVKDDTRLFEKICLEGFQSGLSWIT